MLKSEPTSVILNEAIPAVVEPTVPTITAPEDMAKFVKAVIPRLSILPAIFMVPPSMISVPPSKVRLLFEAFPILKIPAVTLREPKRVIVPPVADNVAPALFSQIPVEIETVTFPVKGVTVDADDNLKLPLVSVRKLLAAVK